MTALSSHDHLDALRARLSTAGVDGFFIPMSDEFMCEYVPASAQRLGFLTGFTGSAGSALVLADKAAFFTDGRYTIQALAEVDGTAFERCSISKDQPPMETISPLDWIARNAKPGQKIAYDPWLHSAAQLTEMKAVADKAGFQLVPLAQNPIDAIWQSRPPAPQTPAVPHDMVYAGVASADKRASVAATIRKAGCEKLVIATPENIAWLLNIRGNDTPNTPLPLSYALLSADGTVDLYIDPAKMSQETRAHLGDNVRVHDISAFESALSACANQQVMLDAGTTPAAIENLLEGVQARIHHAQNPIELMKAVKNPVEINGTIRAHVRDGVAMTRFLAALAKPGAVAAHSEISSSDLLEKIRSEGEHFKGLSFDTISGAGGNGAIVHYRSSDKTNAPLGSGPVYLVDSGAQYLDGTTDITRTLAVGTPNAEMKENFTRVLKGHIQVALSVFPPGTTGDVIDKKARAALQAVGRDFAHGTGHGVGSYLSVHEGPAGINPRATSQPLLPGMILSNEPGYYKTGEYGIRIENLVLVVERPDGMLGFKNLTMAPIELNLVDPALLTAEETDYLNAYHAEVRETLLPHLSKIDPDAADFLIRATQALPHAPASTNGHVKKPDLKP